MEVVAAVASSLNSVNVLATSNCQKLTYPSTLTTCLPTKQDRITLCPRNRSLVSQSRCFTKPDTNTSDDTMPSSISEPDAQTLITPASDDSLSSSFSSISLWTGLVLGLGPSGSWDSKEIGSPVVKRFLSDEEERWYMWYHGNSGSVSDSVGLAVSSNGIHWERGVGSARSSEDVGLVMKCSQDWWAFDTLSIRPSEVIIMSSAKVRASSAVYWLYYTGFNPEKVDFVDDQSLNFRLENPERFYIDNGKILKSFPGLAMSQDGRHWARIEGEHHSGALFDVGHEREWDSLFIASPQVVFHGSGDLRMYYHSFDVEKGQFGIGIARSRDGINWVKLGKIIGGGKSGSFDELGGKNACVVRNKKDRNYAMAYEGIAADGKRSIGMAVSPDGLKEWRRYQDEAVLKPSLEDGWDNRGVGCPSLVQMNGDADEWRLYYAGIGNEGLNGIGMAVSHVNDVSCFRRWTGFKL